MEPRLSNDDDVRDQIEHIVTTVDPEIVADAGPRAAAFMLDQAETIRQQQLGLTNTLNDLSTIQPRVLAMLRREGFVFETPLHLMRGWEKLAFSLYTTICEVDARVRQAIEENG